MTKKANKFIILGPCALESYDQIKKIVTMAQKRGLIYIRAQVYKPRTSPKSFQGMADEGIEILKRISSEFSDIKLVCEACSNEQFETLKDVASILQIGARNMQNFELLKYVAKNFNKSNCEYVLLKRGFANTQNEWIEAANYLIDGGISKDRIILCERGSRSLTSPTGVSLDFINALEAKEKGFKVILDPSHGTRLAKYVLPLTKASLALNLDGVIIEVHPNPKESVSDKDQAISIADFEDFIESNLI